MTHMGKQIKAPAPSPTKKKLLYAIVAQLVETGRAKFDFGVFQVFKRDGGVVKLITGKDAGKVRRAKPYITVAFRASEALKRELKSKARQIPVRKR